MSHDLYYANVLKTTRRRGIDMSLAGTNQKRQVTTMSGTNTPKHNGFCTSNTYHSPRVSIDNPCRKEESRVIIRQQELVEFAKKFAIYKANYEYQLYRLSRYQDKLKHYIRKLINECYSLRSQQKSKDYHYRVQSSYINSLISDGKRLEEANKELSGQVLRLEQTVQSLRIYNVYFSTHLEQKSENLNQAREQIRELKEQVKSKPSVCHTSTSTDNNFDCYYGFFELYKSSQNKLNTLIEYLGDLDRMENDNGKLKKILGFYERQNELLVEAISRCNSHTEYETAHVIHLLQIELNDKNKRIFELSEDLAALKNHSLQASRPEIEESRHRESDIETVEVYESQSDHSLAASESSISRLCLENSMMKNEIERLNRVVEDHVNFQNSITNMYRALYGLRKEGNGPVGRRKVVLRRPETEPLE